jgi:hypothetical protein
MTEDNKRTAIHEAGHAVIGRVVGMACDYATIESDHDSSGHSITADPYETSAQWERAGKYRGAESVLRGRIMTFQAGAEAEIEVFGSCPGGDGDDQYQITLMAEHAGWTEDKVLNLRRYTRLLVKRHRVKIERVACALLKSRCLGAEQIDALVWPKAEIENLFVPFEELRPRLGLVATRKQVELAMQADSFPRGYLFNGAVMWRVTDIQSAILSMRKAPKSREAPA